jgi:hypothetical protein
MTADIDPERVRVLEGEVDELVDLIAEALESEDDAMLLECDQAVGELLADIDLLLGTPTLH